ncbi:MAG: TadE/TadG family type IV pilus assembly protein [Polyangiales bacterium]
MKLSAPTGDLLAHEQGAVFLEFLVVIVPLWVFFLCIVQLAFFSHANLLVKHAADSAARSASVVLPDDPAEYGGEPKMTVSRSPLAFAEIASGLDALSSSWEGLSDTRPPNYSDQAPVANLGRSRLNTIRLAAHVPLMSLAPANMGFDRSPTIRAALASRRSIAGSFFYQPFAVAVTFPGFSAGVLSEPEITVRVTYALQCRVPVARTLLCSAFDDLGATGDFDAAFLPLIGGLVRGRFKKFQHETTLLIHDAPYAYRPQGAI